MEEKQRGIEEKEMGFYEVEICKYPLWAKWLFLPFYSLWLGWLYILGAELTANLGGKKWIMK